MTIISFLQIFLYVVILLILVKPLGMYMAHVYTNKPSKFDAWIYRICNINSEQGMDWKNYLIAMLIFNLVGILLVYFIQRCQFLYGALITPDLAFNNAISFTSNTDWQAYGTETNISYFTQMLAFTVQNFISAATSISLLVALIRGFARREDPHLGNFWVDTVRGIIYIFLPLAFIFAIILVSQGVIQNFKTHQKIQTIYASEQVIPMGPVASQVAIKQLGSNGGGFFNANSAHPFENPTVLTNFLEMLAMLLIPTALCYMFGTMINDKKQGWAILITIFIMFIFFASIAINAESSGNTMFNKLAIDQTLGNMQGKEIRFGVNSSALWATATATASHGSVNSMLDAYTPLGGLVPLFMLHIGMNLYHLLMLIILTVFVAGLMVGRTPEYLGKKIEPFEMKMAALAVLITPMIVLLCTAIACVTQSGTSSVTNPGAHGFTQIFYAFSSMANNNGSAFAGLQANTFFYNVLGGITMLIGRYWSAIPALAIAGSLARKKIIPANPGTLETHTLLFIIFLAGTIVTSTALTFFPAMALGPIVEQLMLWQQYGN